MKTSAFDQQHLPTLSVQEGYTAFAATYDAVKAEGLMDYPLRECIQTVVWEQLEAIADARLWDRSHWGVAQRARGSRA
jgi:hypothetical protein